jgi:hypothetical protein
MKRLIFVAPIRLVGAVTCRIPSCAQGASAHIDIYMCAIDDQTWDARGSGPYCHTHLERMQADWKGCEVRGDAAMERALAHQSA